jgi:HAD superfamily hydrolase (TIGR01549 family)
LKNVDTFLFDLDGTLLPMDLDEFTRLYFCEIGREFKDIMEPETLVKYIWSCTKDMISNTERRTNEEVFMDSFAKLVGEDKLNFYRERFDRFYDTAFLKTKKCIGSVPCIRESVYILKDKGYQVAIATNPLFPEKAILHRIRWAGLKPEDFIYISCYERNCYCKPNKEFYEEVLEEIGKKPEQCIMVGNDVQEDLIAGCLGMKTYLITDYLIHRTGEPIKCTYKGTYQDFYRFVMGLPALASVLSLKRQQAE